MFSANSHHLAHQTRKITKTTPRSWKKYLQIKKHFLLESCIIVDVASMKVFTPLERCFQGRVLIHVL